MDAIVLAGGKGQRMNADTAKVLVKVKGKPILEWQLDYLLPQTDQIILALGHHAEEIQEFIGKKYAGENIAFSIEKELRGTAGAVRNALPQVKSPTVLVLNGDDLTNIDIKALSQKKENTVCVCHPQLPFGLVTTHNGYAVFTEKPTLQEWVSCGWYLFNTRQLETVLPAKGSLEYEVFPHLPLRVHPHEGLWRPLNTPKDIEEAEKMDLEKILGWKTKANPTDS